MLVAHSTQLSFVYACSAAPHCTLAHRTLVVTVPLTLTVCLHDYRLHVTLLAEQQAPVCCLLPCPFLAKPTKMWKCQMLLACCKKEQDMACLSEILQETLNQLPSIV